MEKKKNLAIAYRLSYVLQKASHEAFYKKQLLKHPKEILAKEGVDLEKQNIVCHENTDKDFYITIPLLPIKEEERLWTLCENASLDQIIRFISTQIQMNTPIKKELFNSAHSTLRKKKVKLPKDLKIHICQNTLDTQHLVIPRAPTNTITLNDLELQTFAGKTNYLNAFITSIVEEYKKLGGVFNRYENLWLQVTAGKKPDKLFKKEFRLLSDKEKESLYDAAYNYNNPFIHEKANELIRADEYSINLMWINKNKNSNQEFLFSEGTTSKKRQSNFQKRFIKPISKWAKANPKSPINIWIDGKMTSYQAINRSKKALKDTLAQEIYQSIHFRDVRSINLVHSNPQLFSSTVPIYFRADLLRAITADHVLRNKESKFFVYADIDMNPLSRKKIFDKRTLNLLHEYGFVMAMCNYSGIKNGFQILNGDNTQLLYSHRKILIDLNIEVSLEKQWIDEEQIYRSYQQMFLHLLDADGRYGKLIVMDKVIENSTEKTYHLRIDRFENTSSSPINLERLQSCNLKTVMPKKPIFFPVSLPRKIEKQKLT